MCGTERYLLPLPEEGFNVQGFDASEHMLETLDIKAKAKNLKPFVWKGFVEDLQRVEKYNLIFIPSGSFCLITVYLANSHNGHILAEEVLPDALNPALNYFFPTYGFARNVSELARTDFHGLNPAILKEGLQKQASETKSSTKASPHCEEHAQQYKGRLQEIKNPTTLYGTN